MTSITRIIATTVAGVLCAGTLAGCAGAGEDGAPRATPGAAATPASDACVQAMREKLAAALYNPGSGVGERLPECADDSDEAVEAAAEQLLREAFPTPTKT